MKKPVAIVLGGTNAHIFLIRELKQRGYRVVLIDYLECPPAAIHCDLHLRESTLDFKVVEKHARELDAKLVISTSVDQANVTACYVAEQLHLPKPYSYETALCIASKSAMKEKLLTAQVPTTKYFVVQKVTEVKEKIVQLKFPVVVKPSDSNGSKGVRVANTVENVENFVENALNISRNGDVIVEEYFEGEELSLDCFVHKGVGSLLLVRRKYNVTVPGENIAIQCYASLAPYKLNLKQESKIKSIIDGITKEFALQNTSLLIQVLVNGDDINVIEFAARVGGGLSGRTVKLSAGFDIVAATVDSYLGIPVNTNLSQGQQVYLTNNVFTQAATIGEIKNYQQLVDNGVVKELYIHKKSGDNVSGNLESRDRALSFIVAAEDLEQLEIKVDAFFDIVSIVDADGKDILRRDIRFRDVKDI